MEISEDGESEGYEISSPKDSVWGESEGWSGSDIAVGGISLGGCTRYVARVEIPRWKC